MKLIVTFRKSNSAETLTENWSSLVDHHGNKLQLVDLSKSRLLSIEKLVESTKDHYNNNNEDQITLIGHKLDY